LNNPTISHPLQTEENRQTQKDSSRHTGQSDFLDTCPLYTYMSLILTFSQTRKTNTVWYCKMVFSQI